MIASLQKLFGKHIISSAIKKPRKKEIHNFQTTNTIGIVFSVTDSWDMRVLEKFIQETQKYKIKVNAIGWVNNKLLPEKYKENGTYSYITKRDLNFFGIPNSEKFRNFTNQKFDVLIDCSYPPDIITSIVSAKTNAEMKISRDIEETHNIFDFLIKSTENIKQDIFFEQVSHYLTTINSIHNETK